MFRCIASACWSRHLAAATSCCRRRRGCSSRGKNHGGRDATELHNCLRAVELHRSSFHATREALLRIVLGEGVKSSQASDLVDAWLINGDFLLAPLSGAFDFVVGNPPYMRQELIADVLLAEYRRRYHTLYDRADIYIPFIERSLMSLAADGKLGFICADRWMKNRYGGPLRELVARHFRLSVYVDMVDTPAFHSDVIAYPAITVISREKCGPSCTDRSAHSRKSNAKASLPKLSARLLAPRLEAEATDVRELMAVTEGSEPWILDSSDQLALVRQLESKFPTIEAAGCRVGIGVATGADKAFIGPFEKLDVEPDRKLPLAMTRDILSGAVEWQGLGVINPFAEVGGLVNLADYPRLGRYLEARKNVIAKRHVATKAPGNWYRTIDRIYPALASQQKLLIPDIKGKAHVVYEDGHLYPHHNLYFITSDSWDLRALQAVLMSGIARVFVSAYSTRMRGGFLRFQAQYLRRIRLPLWSHVKPNLQIEARRRRQEEGPRGVQQGGVRDLWIERAGMCGSGREWGLRCHLTLSTISLRPARLLWPSGAIAPRRSRSRLRPESRIEASALALLVARTWTASPRSSSTS